MRRRPRYPNAQKLTIIADCDGSNGACVRLWKVGRNSPTTPDSRSRSRTIHRIRPNGTKSSNGCPVT